MGRRGTCCKGRRIRRVGAAEEEATTHQVKGKGSRRRRLGGTIQVAEKLSAGEVEKREGQGEAWKSKGKGKSQLVGKYNEAN